MKRAHLDTEQVSTMKEDKTVARQSKVRVDKNAHGCWRVYGIRRNSDHTGVIIVSRFILFGPWTSE